MLCSRLNPHSSDRFSALLRMFGEKLLEGGGFAFEICMESARANKPLRSKSWGLICNTDGSPFVTNLGN